MYKQQQGGVMAVRLPCVAMPLAAKRLGARALAAVAVLALAGTTSIDTGMGEPGGASFLDARDHGRHAVIAPVPGRPLEIRPFAAATQVRKPAALAAEQRNVAEFIAARYQVALGQTQQFVEHAYRTAREARLDPLLILAVMSVESSFNPRAQNPSGAQGLMQVLTRVHLDKFEPFGGAAAAFDPVANIRVGAQILKDYLQRDGTVEGALKGYVGAALLPDDGGYGRKVLSERELIAQAAAGRSIR